MILETNDLTLRYGKRRGIDNVSLSVSEGRIFGFLGPNGAGKSTTIRILMGLMRADSGSALLFGRDCWKYGPALRHDVGYVAGDVRLYSWLTLNRGLSLMTQIRGLDVRSFGLSLAERFRLEPDLPARKMSRGNRQKLALILALAHRPRLIVLDEPTSGLDPLMQDTLMLCLREMASSGSTVVFSSHTLSEVETLCDQIAIIRDGRIVEAAMLKDLQAQAPRRVLLTLHADQKVPEQWPKTVKVLWAPGMDEAGVDSSIMLSVPVSGKQTCCLLELHGPATSIVSWVASQNLADITMGPPSLDMLFRRYYGENAE